ncbi:MAG: DNA polymerase, partial [Clostridia bacterium]|nr:DNA polymerase [Clostridia bacterium]
MAYLSRILGTIVREKEGLSEISNLKRREMNKRELYALFNELEFNSLIKKMGLDTVDTEAEPAAAEAEALNTAEAIILEDQKALDAAILFLSQQEKLAVLPLFEKSFRLGGSLIAISIGTEERSYFLPTSAVDEDKVAASLKVLFENRELTLVCPSVKELYTWALSHNLDLRCRLFDLIVAEYLIDALASHYTVSGLIRKYLGQELTLPEAPKLKGKQMAMDTDTRDWATPMGAAAVAFLTILDKQSAVLTENEQNGLYYDIELPLSLVLGSMEYCGFKVDQRNLEEYRERLDKRITSLEKTIYFLAMEEFNINSPKQLGIILFEKLGLKSAKKTKTGYSTDAEVLQELSDQHEIIPSILEYRQLVKLKSTYAEGLVKVINPETGRIHSSFNQTVTATGRISSTEPNLQNIPIRTELGREIRRAFVPQEGYVFVDADYSQIELRVLAHITGDEMLQKAFKEGVDIHTLTASQVFKVPMEAVTSDMRRGAKAVNFGIVYGISDFSLSKDINVSRKEAARYIDGYL